MNAPLRGQGLGGGSVVDQFRNLNLWNSNERCSPVTNRDVSGSSLDKLKRILGIRGGASAEIHNNHNNNNSGGGGPSGGNGGMDPNYNSTASGNSSMVTRYSTSDSRHSPASYLSIERQQNYPPLFVHPSGIPPNQQQNAMPNVNNNPTGNTYAVQPLVRQGPGGVGAQNIVFHPMANPSGSGIPAPNRPVIFHPAVANPGGGNFGFPGPVNAPAAFEPVMSGVNGPGSSGSGALSPDTVVVRHPNISAGNNGGNPPAFFLADRFRNAPFFFMSPEQIGNEGNNAGNAGNVGNAGNNPGIPVNVPGTPAPGPLQQRLIEELQQPPHAVRPDSHGLARRPGWTR